MGMFDTVSGALDNASQVLAGGQNTPGAAVGNSKPTYWYGRDLDVDKKTESRGQAPNLENALNGYPVIEFIHFGYVHTSHSNFFVHEDYSDREKNDKVKEGDRPRGIQFRSALERESILLSTFMECTQTVLKERDAESPAGLAGALNTLGNVLGSSGGGSGKTTPADLNSHIQKVVGATTPILPDAIEYKDIHQAGCDFHEARANYRARLQKIADEKPTPDPMGGLMGKLPGLGSVAGTFAKVLSFTQGVAFKAQDVKAKFYVLTALQQEPQIEIASNEMTLQAITELYNPFLPVWFGGVAKGENEQWTGAPENPLAGDHGNIGNKVIDPLSRKVDGWRQDGIDKGNAVKKFFESPPETPPPGQANLGVAFTNPPTRRGETSVVPMKMGDVACQAFVKALGLTPPLGIPETIVSGIVAVALEFTEGVYKSLLWRDPDTVIDEAALLASAREDLNIADRLLAMATDKLSFVSDAKKWETPSVAGFQVRPGDMLDKGADKIDELVENKIRPLMDPILSYAMKKLAEQLELGRQNGMNNTCHTMEWYLGRLPWVQSTLFCNLFFPFWNALMRAVADIVDAGTSGALKGILDIAERAKKQVDDVRDKLAQGQAYKKAVEDTVEDYSHLDQNTDFSQKSQDRKDRFTTAKNTKALKTAGPELDQGAFVIPVTGRSEKGQGKKIEKPAYDAVVLKHKWDEAKEAETPAKPADGQAAPTPAAGAA